MVKGDETPLEEREAWEWLRNPLPPAGENALFATLRLQLGIPEQTFYSDKGFGSLGFLEQQAVGQALEPGFLRENNPVTRHTVLRRRQTLEDAGLLEKVGVNVHPNPDAPATAYAGVGFNGLGLLTNLPFDLAYRAAESFHQGAAKTDQGRGIHEDHAASTDLFQFCVRQGNGTRECYERRCLRKKNNRRCWKRR